MVAVGVAAVLILGVTVSLAQDGEGDLKRIDIYASPRDLTAAGNTLFLVIENDDYARELWTYELAAEES